MTRPLGIFVEEIRRQLIPLLGYTEDPEFYLLRCPSGGCGDDGQLVLSRMNGSGFCLHERLPTVGGYRSYSPWEIARLLGMDVCGLYGLFAGPGPVNLPATGPALAGESLRGLRGSNTPTDTAALGLLEDPWILNRFLCLASASGIAGEGDLSQSAIPGGDLPTPR